MSSLFLVGKILFSLLFIMSGISHFMKADQSAQYAAAKGVPAAKFMVVFTGLLEIIGAAAIIFGYELIGAIILLIFLVPTTFIMHRFWGLNDPQATENEMGQFMKNLSLIGALLIILYLGLS